MHHYCVVVANGAQARFYTLEDCEFPELESGPTLIETTKVLHPMRKHHLQYRVGQHHLEAVTDQVDEPVVSTVEQDKRFAHSIAQEASRLSKRLNLSELVLVSQTSMLGHLRQAVRSNLKGVNTQELPKDLSKLSPRELHTYLANEKLLPKRRGPQLVS